jgi:hypothetical protein
MNASRRHSTVSSASIVAGFETSPEALNERDKGE